MFLNHHKLCFLVQGSVHVSLAMKALAAWALIASCSSDSGFLRKRSSSSADERDSGDQRRQLDVHCADWCADEYRDDPQQMCDTAECTQCGACDAAEQDEGPQLKDEWQDEWPEHSHFNGSCRDARCQIRSSGEAAAAVAAADAALLLCQHLRARAPV